MVIYTHNVIHTYHAYIEKVLSYYYLSKTYLHIYVIMLYIGGTRLYREKSTTLFSLSQNACGRTQKRKIFVFFVCNIFCLFSMHKNLAYTFPIHTPTQENFSLYIYVCM